MIAILRITTSLLNFFFYLLNLPKVINEESLNDYGDSPGVFQVVLCTWPERVAKALFGLPILRVPDRTVDWLILAGYEVYYIDLRAVPLPLSVPGILLLPRSTQQSSNSPRKILAYLSQQGGDEVWLVYSLIKRIEREGNPCTRAQLSTANPKHHFIPF